jgi:hypothetical protein
MQGIWRMTLGVDYCITLVTVHPNMMLNRIAAADLLDCRVWVLDVWPLLRISINYRRIICEGSGRSSSTFDFNNVTLFHAKLHKLISNIGMNGL